MGFITKTGEVSESFARTVAEGIGLSLYRNNLEATAQLIELLFLLKGKDQFKSSKDYIRAYESFNTYENWNALLKHEGGTEDSMIDHECHFLIGRTIHKLPCGYFVWQVNG